MADTIVEEWRIVESRPAYAVSSFGRVRREVSGKGAKVGKILKQLVEKRKYSNYISVNLGQGKHWSVHVLVCSAFHGSKPSPQHEVAHWDGNGENNTPNNLRWATRKENKADQVRHGRINRGSLHGCAKLDEQAVQIIRQRLKNGERQTAIAKDFSVNSTTIHQIKRKTKWGWLEDLPTQPENLHEVL